MAIKLYDYKGQMVLCLFDGFKASGSYIENYSLENISPGIYLISIESNTEQYLKRITKKLIVE